MTQLSDLQRQTLTDTKFMTAEEKKKVLKQWEAFLESGCKKERFTKLLYHHLIDHCSFIAHYDINGFYSTYFESGDDILYFLAQFDDSKGPTRSIEFGMAWNCHEDYRDINSEMVRIAGKYIPLLTKQANARQKDADIAQAKCLLARHGIELKEGDINV